MRFAAVRLRSSRIGRRTADVAVPWVIVPDARAAMAALAAEFYGHPSRSMQVVGITGTNGKTTTAYLLRAVFESAGKKCGLLGTVSLLGWRPGAAGRAHDAGGTGCAADVSADGRRGLRRVRHGSVVARARAAAGRRHGVRCGRVHESDAGPSRLSRRHGVVLHRQEAAVRHAAARRAGVINLDDPRGESLRKTVSTPITYAINKPADVTPGPLTLTFEGLEFDARTPKGAVHVQVEARRAPERLEHSRDGRRRDGARHSGGRDRARAREPRRSARPVRAGVERQGRHHGRDRLRAHRRRAEEPARDGAAAGASAASSPCSAAAAIAIARSGR